MKFIIRFNKKKYNLITLSDYFSSVQDTETAKDVLFTHTGLLICFFKKEKTFVIVEASKLISERAKVHTSH